MLKNIKSKILDLKYIGWTQYIHPIIITKDIKTPSLLIFILKNAYLSSILKDFWNKVMNNLDDKQSVKIIMRLKVIENDRPKIITLSKLQIVNKNDFKPLLRIFYAYIQLKSEAYEAMNAVEIIFSYQVSKEAVSLFTPAEIISKKVQSKFGGYTLPTDADHLNWGKVVQQGKKQIVITDDNFTYSITLKGKNRTVEVISGKDTLLKFEDTFSNENTYIRRLDQHIYHISIKNGVVLLKKVLLKTNFMKKSVPEKVKSFNCITFDIETFEQDGKLVPFLIEFFDGEKSWKYDLINFNSSDEMMAVGIKSIMKRTYNGYSVYAHNFSKFDGIFILRVLAELGEVTPIVNGGQFVKTTLSWNPNNNQKPYKLHFKDSMLIVKASLKSLAISFNVESKDLFPILFPNANNLGYSGQVPDKAFFPEISQAEYNEYKKGFQGNNWNLMQEAHKYCQQDCRTLYLVLEKFNDLIFNKFSVNINKYPTLPSLAMGIYKTKYLKANCVPILNVNMFKDLSPSYTGGRTDVFIPTNKVNNNNIKLFSYDVNSLYPFIMKTCLMPVGNIFKFEGNIFNINPNAFGIFEAKIIAPDMKIPLLQTKITTSGGLRTLAPIGNWTGSYTSEELKLAMKHGYKIEVLRGYTFDSAIIFSKYVTELFKIKETTPKSDPMYLVAKLLMNSLYGKFGMRPILPNNIIISYNKVDEFIKTHRDKYEILDILYLNNGNYLVSYILKEEDILNDNIHKNINVAIASFITSYARIHMAQFLLNPNYKVYYTDTDSLVIDRHLLPEFIHDKTLGLLSLDFIYDEFIAVAPKVYGGTGHDSKGIPEEFVKIKGFRNKLSFNDFKDLLNINSTIELNQDKWFKDISTGSIKIINQPYFLSSTENKRSFVIENSKLVDTIPHVLIDGELT